ncbi:MAG: SDR family oxidoreductase [bacterium]|nr:SDR family oxidoreductase [bacterium]
MEKKQKRLVAVVTGGTKGIGFAIAQTLLELDFKVVICSRSQKDLKVSSKKLDPTSTNILGIRADITKEEDVENLIKHTINQFGRIDVLVNNAGTFGPFGPFETLPWDKVLGNIKVNLLGGMYLCYQVIPHMKQQGSGKIINLSGGGVGGDTPLMNGAPYYTAKTGIVAFTEVLASELKDFGITVNAILPGRILTDLSKQSFDIPKDKLGPVLTQATEKLKGGGGESLIPATNLIAFLVSKKASRLTGKFLSAKWDSLANLEKSASNNLYNLRRIEGKIYRREKS